ncbi:MAG: hypothetical protein K6B54_08390 [Clostridia bacterium]|nr:hypothetical protein [Clostridia bacterium]
MTDGKYENIINLPHHVSKVHPQLSKESYAAQFSPFAALTGYDDIVFETARYTEERSEGTDSQSIELDRKLSFVLAELEKGYFPEISVRYFRKDATKEGGEYLIFRGNVKKIDFGKKKIVFTDGSVIFASDVADIYAEFIGDTD